MEAEAATSSPSFSESSAASSCISDGLAQASEPPGEPDILSRNACSVKPAPIKQKVGWVPYWYLCTYRPKSFVFHQISLQIIELIIVSSLFIKKSLSYRHYPLPNCQIITTSSSSFAKSLLSLVKSLLCKR